MKITTHESELDDKGLLVHRAKTKEFAVVLHHEATVEELYMTIAKLQWNTSDVKGLLFSLGSAMRPAAKTPAPQGARQVFAAFTPIKEDNGREILDMFVSRFTGKKEHERYKSKKQVWGENCETIMKFRV